MPNHITMKKIFLIIALALFCTGMAAQKVTSNERDEQGMRTIETGMRAFYVDHHLHGCQLTYMEKDGVGRFNILFSISDQASRWVAKKGQVMLMKDKNGKVYEIPAGGASIYQLARSTSRTGGISYMVALPYFLDDEQAQVFDNGLTKIRIAYTYEDTGGEGLMDIEIPSDLSDYLKKAKKNIDKTIPLPVSVDKSVF
jgi:hypothetical protein